MVDQHDLIRGLEDKAEDLVRKTRKYLPHIGRACLVSTFVEDGVRMVNQWGEQRDYIGNIFIVPFALYAKQRETFHFKPVHFRRLKVSTLSRLIQNLGFLLIFND